MKKLALVLFAMITLGTTSLFAGIVINNYSKNCSQLGFSEVGGAANLSECQAICGRNHYSKACVTGNTCYCK